MGSEEADSSYISMMYELTEKTQARTMRLFETTNDREQIIAWDNERYQKIRAETEPLVFAHLQERYGKMLTDFWQTYLPPLKTPHAFVMCERRAHPNMWFILRNIAWAGPNMAVFIFCSSENYSAIKALLGNKANSFHLIQYFDGNPAERKDAIREFNNFYTNYQVYEQIVALSGAEYIVTVQMDNYFRKRLVPQLFVGDYYGACWTWNFDLAGGGGLTMRRVQKMIEICKEHRPNVSIDVPDCAGEDYWIASKIQPDKFPDVLDRLGIFLERSVIVMMGDKKGFIIDPYAVHQTWAYCYQEFSRDEYLFIWKELLTLKV